MRACLLGACAGAALWVANSLPILAGALATPAGYIPLWGIRGQDTAQYFGWIDAMRSAWFIPNYFAPWHTEPALQVPVLWLVAQAARAFAVPAPPAYVAFHIAAYVLAGVGLALLLRLFTISRRDAVFSLLAMICMLPLRALILLPALRLRPANWAWSSAFGSFSGGGTSDGFFQGVSGSATVTLGTASALLALVCLGRYAVAPTRKKLAIASAVIGLAAFLHPFEFIPLLAAGLAVLVRLCALRPAALIADAAILLAPSALSAAFYAVSARAGWTAVAADLNRYSAFAGFGEIVGLGAGMLAALLLVVVYPQRMPALDFLLASYVVAAVVAYVSPGLPWPAHMIDGVYYAAAILIVHQWHRVSERFRLNTYTRRLVYAGAAGVLALSVIAHVYFRYTSLRLAGEATALPSMTTAVAPVDEKSVLEWLRRNGAAQDLAFAPVAYAPWIATVPMHSFASHWLFSLTFDEQSRQSERFFGGALSEADARALLELYGVRWLIVPRGSAGERYASGYVQKLATPTLNVYEVPGASMRPFPQLVRVAPRRYVWPPAGRFSLLSFVK